jgi:hypothetical protein
MSLFKLIIDGLEMVESAVGSGLLGVALDEVLTELKTAWWRLNHGAHLAARVTIDPAR